MKTALLLIVALALVPRAEAAERPHLHPCARFTRDVPVYGTALWKLRTGAVRASLTIPGRGRLRVRWNVRNRLAVATLAGRIDGRRLRAAMLAP